MTTILKSKQLRAFPFSGSAIISGSLNVTNAVTASYFKGDGSQLTGVIAEGSGVVILDDNVVKGTARYLNFGTNISASVTSGTASINVRVDTDNLDKVFYVTEQGSDINNGKSIGTAFRTIKAAALAASQSIVANGITPTLPYRTTIRVKTGYYVEEAPIVIANNVSILGDDLRSVVVRPSDATSGSNLFLMNNGSYAFGLRLEGCAIDNLEDPKNGFFFAFQPSASISTSPYVQNCSAIRTPPDKFYTPLDSASANPLVGNGPGGMLIDDAVLDPYSPLHSMIVDSYTQVAFNGIGVCARGRGYGQMVSFFTNFSRVGVYAKDGGHCSLLNSNTTFGDFGLRSSGSRILVNPNTTLVTSASYVDAVSSALILANTSAVTTYMINELAISGSTQYTSSYQSGAIRTATLKDAGLLVKCITDDLLSPTVVRVSQFGSGQFLGQDTTVGKVRTLPTQSSFSKGAVTAFRINDGFDMARDYLLSYDKINYYIQNNATFSSVPTTTKQKVSQLLNMLKDTIQRVVINQSGADLLTEFGSLITSTSHDFSYAGSGVNFLALPNNQGGVGKTNLDLRVYQENNGRVYYTAGDETGDQYQGNDFIIRQSTGTIEGRTFYRAITAQITPINLALETV